MRRQASTPATAAAHQVETASQNAGRNSQHSLARLRVVHSVLGLYGEEAIPGWVYQAKEQAARAASCYLRTLLCLHELCHSVNPICNRK